MATPLTSRTRHIRNSTSRIHNQSKLLRRRPDPKLRSIIPNLRSNTLRHRDQGIIDQNTRKGVKNSLPVGEEIIIEAHVGVGSWVTLKMAAYSRDRTASGVSMEELERQHRRATRQRPGREVRHRLCVGDAGGEQEKGNDGGEGTVESSSHGEGSRRRRESESEREMESRRWLGF